MPPLLQRRAGGVHPWIPWRRASVDPRGTKKSVKTSDKGNRTAVPGGQEEGVKRQFQLATETGEAEGRNTGGDSPGTQW